MNRRLWIFVLLQLAGCLAYAQTRSKHVLQGTILTLDRKPAAFVSVVLKNTRAGALTDENGHWTLRNVPSGAQVLVVRIVGYESREIPVQVAEGQTTTVETIQLNEDHQTLQEVTVTGTNRFGQRESEYAARLPIKNLENPQVYNVVTKELAQEQLAVDYKNMLRNVPGAGVGFGGVNNGVTYLILRGFWVTSQVRNGMASQQYAGIDPVNVEKVEVYKGPSGTLFGSSLISFGGLSNLVTKKPYETFGGEVSYTGGKWGLSRLAVDVNTPLNDDKSALLRVNAAAHSERSFQNFGFQRSYAVAPSFSFKVNDRLSFLVDAEFYKTERSTMPANSFTNVTFKNIKNAPIGYTQSINSNDPLLKMGSQNVFIKADYKISRNWVSTTQYAYGNVDFNNVNYIWPATWTSDSTIVRNLSTGRSSYTRSSQFQQNVTGDIRLGALRNRVVIGVDAYGYVALTQSLGTIAYDVINIRKPIIPISMAKVEQLAANATMSTSLAKQNRYSVYISDVLNINDKLMAMASVRVEKLDNQGTSVNGQTPAASGVYQQTAVSPKFGVVYQPIKDQLSVFANYMNGFQNVAPITQPDQSVFSPKPQYGNQWEVGAKAETFGRRLAATVSYYTINLSNAVRVDPTRPGFQIQDGTQESKGIELDIVANPVPGLNLVAGYGHNAYKYTKSSAANEGQGSGLPADMANFWASYRFQTGAVKGIGLGIGGNYVSACYPNNESGALTIPSYTKFDATAFYDQPKWRLGIKLNNFTGQKYWGLNYDPQPLRQFIASLSYKL